MLQIRENELHNVKAREDIFSGVCGIQGSFKFKLSIVINLNNKIHALAKLFIGIVDSLLIPAFKKIHRPNTIEYHHIYIRFGSYRQCQNYIKLLGFYFTLSYLDFTLH